MIEEKYVDLYAKGSGIKDKLVAERDVVLTYALRVLLDHGVAKDLAFKGGTCLRKNVFGPKGRFSEDLDFTLVSKRDQEDVFTDVYEIFNRTKYDVSFRMEEIYQTEESSFGGEVLYSHPWNETGRFDLQISIREEPVLPLAALPFKECIYFKYLEFPAFDTQCMQPIEMIAEKTRAGYQRAKVRDLYDLFLFSTELFSQELLRKLVVLKLWSVKDPFDPEAFFARIDSREYDWDNIKRLIRNSEKLEAKRIKRTVQSRYAFLAKLTDIEKQVIAGSKGGKGKAEVDRLREEAEHLFEQASS